jgi:hypothetical protein
LQSAGSVPWLEGVYHAEQLQWDLFDFPMRLLIIINCMTRAVGAKELELFILDDDFSESILLEEVIECTTFPRL